MSCTMNMEPTRLSVTEYAHGDFYKKFALEIARELFYGDSVIEKIRNAKTDREISHILSRARNGER